jgi:LCP family protein required for cell wall assembly
MDSIRRPQPVTAVSSSSLHTKVEPEVTSYTKNPTLESPTKTPPLYTKRRRLPWKRIARFSMLFIGIALLALILFFGKNLFQTLNTIQIKDAESPSFFSQVSTLTKSLGKDPFLDLKKTDDGRVNILLLGRAGENYPGKNLTDTIIILSLDSDKRKVALISLPRDLYITLPEERVAGKINSLYQYGLSQNKGTELIEKSVTAITGEPLHYTFVLDFDGFEKIIDTFGGIELEVMRDIYDERYPGKNYSYETFELKQGWQKLDGKTALKYVRERHDDPEGDFGRAKRQQQVLTALKEKAFSNSLLFNINAVNELLTILGDSVKTDASLSEMESFLRLAKKIDTQNIETVVVDAWKKESLLRVSHIELGGVRAFILVPRTSNWQETRELSQSIFSHEQNLKRQVAIEEEKASIGILYQKKDAPRARQTRQILEEIFPGEISMSQIDTYQEWPKQSMLLDRVALQKTWSLDTLLKKLALEKISSLPFAEPKLTSDIFLILGSDPTNPTMDELSLQETTELDAKEGDALIIEQNDL